MRKYILAFFGLALLLSACRIESNIILDINEDGSATVGAEVGFDEDMLDLVSQNGGDPADLLSELPNFDGEEVEPINRVEGDMTFFGFTTTVEDLSTYDFAGLQGETFSEFIYESDDSSATLTATVDATGIGDFGGGELPIDPSEITADLFSARVLVTMPGSVTEHNADEITGDGTLIWNLPLSGSVDMFATSTFGSNTAPFWFWVVVGGILIFGTGAAIAAVMRSRKNSEKAVAAAAASYQQPENEPSDDSSQPIEELPEDEPSEGIEESDS
ncbi:MAG: hypothetical protein M3112_04810 [Actinomycetia bacterium]|nr:hypothetical protein [Actinomycetes bacterium]